MSGFFLTLEGIDGCGKSTQAARLLRWFEELGWSALRTFEPGGWEGGAALRSLILAGGLPKEAELLLFLADRGGHLETVIRPALAKGQAVLCERYSDSTWAYQMGGRGLAPDRVARLMEGCGFPEPDLTVFLDIEPELAARRLVARGKRDSIEAAGIPFMARVAEAYRALAQAQAGRIVTVPAEGSEDEVFARLTKGLAGRVEALL